MPLNNTEQNIKELLENNLHARTSDNALILVYYSVYENIDVESIPVSQFYTKIEQKKIPTTVYVLRCARKVKEKYPELGGNRDIRKEKEQEYAEEFYNH